MRTMVSLHWRVGMETCRRWWLRRRSKYRELELSTKDWLAITNVYSCPTSWSTKAPLILGLPESPLVGPWSPSCVHHPGRIQDCHELVPPEWEEEHIRSELTSGAFKCWPVLPTSVQATDMYSFRGTAPWRLDWWRRRPRRAEGLSLN